MMGRIVGKVWYIVCLIISFGICASTALRVVDEDGDSVKKVQVGRPFTIELQLSGGGSLDDAPTIEGLKQFTVHDSSWSHSIINGHVTISYRYNVIAKHPGIYTLGPALFSRNGVREVSNTVKLEVGTQPVSDADKESPVLVRLSVDKDRVVQGERIIATLRYYYADPSERLCRFIEQKADDIIRKKERGPRQGVETINDTKYNYIELNWDMYPEHAGTLTIPAFAAEYEVKLKRDNLFGGMSRLLGIGAAQKRAYSNAVTIQVDAIPHSDEPVQGVGIFDSFEISAHPSVVTHGEGAIVTITLKGDFDPDKISFPGLQNVPNELRYYESQESATDPSSEKDAAVKRFEYIVQGLQVGSWQIPPQKFHYYDVATRSHRILTTAPLSITIMPGVSKPAPITPSDSETDAKEKALPLSAVGLYPIGESFSMPWWLFCMLVVIPFFAWGAQKGRESYMLYRAKTYRVRRSYQAFSHARAQIDRLKKDKQTQRLYALCIELFADKWQIPIGSVTVKYISQRLRDSGMAAHEQMQWDDFFTAVAQHAFSVSHTEQEIQDLFRQAEQWLERLQQLI